MNRYYYEFGGFGFHNGEVEDETNLKCLGDIDIISSECSSKMENWPEILKDKENQSLEKIAEALYCLNKQAKKIRDERENLKTELFENYKYYDSCDWEYSHPKEAIKEWETGCDWAICCDSDGCQHPEELEKDDPNYEPEHETSYCSRYNLCDECQKEINCAESEIEELNKKHEKLSEMKNEISELYEQKDEIIEWLKIEKNITPIGYHTFPDSEYQGQTEYNEERDDDYDEDDDDEDYE